MYYEEQNKKAHFRWCKLGIFNPGKNIGIVWYVKIPPVNVFFRRSRSRCKVSVYGYRWVTRLLSLPFRSTDSESGILPPSHWKRHVQSVFDIAWYTFARLVADVAPPIDKDMDYFESQGSILTCMACGEYFVRHSSRQRYCNNPNCQAERNNRKARAYYERKKEQQ